MFASFLSFFFKLYILCLLLSFPSSAFLFCRSFPAFCLQSFRTLRVYPRFFPSSLLPSFLPFVACGVVVASMQLPENASTSQDTMPANANEEVATAKREEKKRCICFIRSSAASSKRSSSQRVSSEEGVGSWDLTPWRTELQLHNIRQWLAMHLKVMHSWNCPVDPIILG